MEPNVLSYCRLRLDTWGLKAEQSLTLRTVGQDVVFLTGASVDFDVASPAIPSKQHLVERAYTASRLT